MEIIITYGEASLKNTMLIICYGRETIDRAILKLLGLHGFVYSEDEMDLSQTNTNNNKVVQVILMYQKFQEQIDTSTNAKVLKGYGKMYAKAMTKQVRCSSSISTCKTKYENKLSELNGRSLMYNSITIVGNLGRDPEKNKLLRVATMPSLVLQPQENGRKNK